MAHEAKIVARMLGEPYVDTKIKALGKDSNSAPTVISILDYDTEKEALLVVNTIIMSAFEASGFPVTGKIFSFTAGTIREGKNYRDIDVVEMVETNE